MIRRIQKKYFALSALALGVVAVAACDSDNDDARPAKTVTGVEFIGMAAPATAADMARSYSAAVARVSYSDSTSTDVPLSYQVLFKNTDRVGNAQHAAGQLYDRAMMPLTDALGQPVVAETPDGNSLLKVGDKLFLVTHFEYDWILSDGSEATARMPMSMTLASLDQDEGSGALSASALTPIDFSGVNGLWVPCFASQTPWNTHLGSEENYDADARTVESGSNTVLSGMNEHYFRNTAAANPYHYGVIPEVTVAADGSTSVVKHFAMGRATWEMAKVMPDQRTVYFGDDGTNVGLFMFVADAAADLSAGTLYAAKWTQTSAANGGTATLSWYRLGHGTDAEIKALADTTTFSGIFDSGDAAACDAAAGYKLIRAGQSSNECLRVKSGQEQAAAFLEPRRYAALLGATTEWNKMEGVAVNAAGKKLYVAMSYIDKGMKADATAPADHIQLAKLNAGATYELQLAGGQRDIGGTAINSEWVATTMAVPAALLGEDIATDALGNTAHPNKVANPDNIFFAEKMRTLFIGEDSGTHVNNFVWAYNVDTGKLSRVLSLVAGAEATGLQVVENVDGHAYIMSNAQHQGDFIGTMDATLRAAVNPLVNKFEAPVGYIGGIPGL